MAFTVDDLLLEASIMAGLHGTRDGPLPPEDSAYGFRKLADLIDKLAGERLAIYREQRVGPFNVTAGQGDITAVSPITIGSGGIWDTPRPQWIDRAGVIYTAGAGDRPELPMRSLDTKEWARISVKGTTATLSRSLYYDRLFNASGLGNIYLYPVPSASFQVVLYVPVAISEFPVDGAGNPIYTTVISLPHGYRSMLISHLAGILSIGISSISADLREHMTDSMATVKASNVVTQMDTLDCDEAILQGGHRSSGFNWLTGGLE